MEGLPDNARIAYDNSPFLKVIQWPFVRENQTAGLQCRAFLGNGVMTIALDETTHEVYVVHQIRESPNGPIITTELPGGGIDDGYTPLQAAVAELLEEAGVKAVDEADWVQLYGDDGTHPLDGLVFTDQHAFLLLRGRRVQNPSGDERTDVSTIALLELIARDNRNEFRDPLSPYALRRAQDWLKEHRPDLLT